MSENLDSLKIQLVNTLHELERGIDQAIEWLTSKGVGPHTLYLTRFIIEEMGTNILKYGYDDKETHMITLELTITKNDLHILLEDDGHEFNPLEAPQPKVSGDMDERTPGGLGIWLVQKFSQMTYTRTETQTNRVEISLRLDCVIQLGDMMP